VKKAAVLALDVGTSSARAALFSEDGGRVPGSMVQQGYSLRTSADGGAELQPDAVERAAAACVMKALRAGRDRELLGVGASCFWHSLMGVDGRGRALTPVFTWADSRSRSDAARLREQLSERAIHRRTGCMLRGVFWAAKLAWLRRTQPAVFRRVARWVSFAEWLSAQWLGESQLGCSMASGTGLLDVRRLRWDDALLDAVGVDAERLGRWDETPLVPAAAPWKRLAGMPWFPAISDGAAGNIGSGATRPGWAALNVGTSAAVRVVAPHAPARMPWGLFCMRVDPARFLIGGACSNAGNLRAWCLRELRLPERDLARLLAQRPEPPPGLRVVPLWTSERAPDWEEEAGGTIHGVTQHTTALDLLQAVTDAGFQRIARIADHLAEAVGPPARIILSGGILKAPHDVQRFADVLGRPLHPCTEPEASLRGAAVHALTRLGFEPPPPICERAVRARPRYHALHRAIRA
jgi:gluconokinase